MSSLVTPWEKSNETGPECNANCAIGPGLSVLRGRHVDPKSRCTGYKDIKFVKTDNPTEIIWVCSACDMIEKVGQL
jgi:hypothetical protein